MLFNDSQAIIVGAGPAGLCTALRLHSTKRIQCSVFELRPEPTTLGGAIGVLSNGLRLLDRLGLYEALRACGNTNGTVITHSAQGDILGVQEDSVSYARSHTGYGYMRIKRTDLMDVLLDAVHEAEIPVFYNKRLVAINDREDSEIQITFSDGTTEKADILLGCDGIHSQVRQLHVDPKLVPEYTGFAGLLSIIPASKVPTNSASQLCGFDITLTQEGMFVAMHCTAAGDEIYWGFSEEVSQPTSENSRDGWEVRRKEEVDCFKSKMFKILEDVKGTWGVAMREIVDATTVVKFYPIYKLPLGGAWSKGRCLLLGDAAHAMPPHAGQGVSMALEDAFLLARMLENPAHSLSEIFDKFDSIRRPRVDEIHKSAARKANTRKKAGPWGLWMKEIFIRFTSWAPWALGLENLGLGQQHLLYDIDEENF